MHIVGMEDFAMAKPEKPETVRFYTELLIRTLEDTADLLGLSSSFFKMDIEFINRRASNEGLTFLMKWLPSLGKAFDVALSKDTKFVLPSGFSGKQYGDIIVPEFLYGLFILVFRTDGKIRENDMDGADKRFIRPLVAHTSYEWSGIQIAAVRSIRQICFMAYKLEYAHSRELEKEKLDRFIAIDASLPQVGAQLALSPSTYRALENAQLLIAYVLRGLNPLDIRPKHGPGSVASGEKPWEKMNFSRFYPKLDEVYGYADYFFFNYQHLADELQSLEMMEYRDCACAKVTLVPKDSRGPRIISMEPLEIQWIQQGLARAITREIERPGNITCGFVNFADQSINGDLARQHSWEGDNVTLDLKDASDRVSVWLVQRLFPPYLFDHLMACRSEHSELPDGRRIALNKFAPMGSACCFPVEALIFWALAVGSTRDVLRTKDLRSLPDVYVYGDDIICQQALGASLGALFNELHLELNEDKCCVGRFFRESCGVDAFKGRDVTPVRLHTVWPGGDFEKSPEALLSYVAYANAFRREDRMFYRTSQLIEQSLRKQFGPLPVMDERGDYPLAFTRNNCSNEESRESLRHFKHRYNADICCDEWKLPVPIALTKECELRSGWDNMHRLSIIGDDPFGMRQCMPSGTFTVPRVVITRWKWVSSDRLHLG